MLDHVFQFKRSRFHCIFLFTVLIFNLIITFNLPLMWYVKLILMTSIFGLLGVYSWKYALVKIKAMKLDPEGWKIKIDNHPFLPVTILGESYVSQWLMVLTLHEDFHQHSHTLVILRDSMAHNNYEELRCLLINYGRQDVFFPSHQSRQT